MHWNDPHPTKNPLLKQPTEKEGHGKVLGATGASRTHENRAIIPAGTDKELKAIGTMQEELQNLLAEHMVYYEYRAILADKGFGTLQDFTTLFENTENLKDSAPRFFRYGPKIESKVTLEEQVLMDQMNHHMCSAWEDAKIQLKEVTIAKEKTEIALGKLKADNYQFFLGSKAGHRLLKLMTEATGQQIVEALVDYFHSHHVIGLHNPTVKNLAKDASFFEPIKKQIFAIKKSRALSQNEDHPEAFDEEGQGIAVSPSDTIKAIFQQWDTDRSGTLELKEFVKLFVHLGMPEKDASAIFKVVDADGSGGIDYNEFTEWLLFAGKSSFVEADEKCADVSSKVAAKAVRVHGEEEVDFMPKQVLYNCSYIESAIADIWCHGCNAFLSKHGFDMTHKEEEMRAHTIVWLVGGRSYDFGQNEEKELHGAALLTADPGHELETVKVDVGVAARALEMELKKQFKAMDLDRGGSISLEEMTQIFQTMHRNSRGPGVILTKKKGDEIDAEALAMFEKLDFDGDGDITMDEFVTGMMKEAIEDVDAIGPDAAATKAAEFTAALKEAIFNKVHRPSITPAMVDHHHKDHHHHHHHHHHHGDSKSHHHHSSDSHHHRHSSHHSRHSKSAKDEIADRDHPRHDREDREDDMHKSDTHKSMGKSESHSSHKSHKDSHHRSSEHRSHKDHHKDSEPCSPTSPTSDGSHHRSSTSKRDPTSPTSDSSHHRSSTSKRDPTSPTSDSSHHRSSTSKRDRSSTGQSVAPSSSERPKTVEFAMDK